MLDTPTTVIWGRGGFVARSRRDSYELKHVFERSPGGLYITDAQFRAGMWLSGFPGRNYPGRQRSYEELDMRYFYVRPKPEGLIDKLVRAGVPSDWAINTIMQ